MPHVFVQDPDDREDYVRDWTQYIGADPIVTSEWLIDVDTPGIVLEDDSIPTPATTKVWVSNVEVGQTYYVTNRIETTGGVKLDWTLTFIGADQ